MQNQGRPEKMFYQRHPPASPPPADSNAPCIGMETAMDLAAQIWPTQFDTNKLLPSPMSTHSPTLAFSTQTQILYHILLSCMFGEGPGGHWSCSTQNRERRTSYHSRNPKGKRNGKANNLESGQAKRHKNIKIASQTYTQTHGTH